MNIVTPTRTIVLTFLVGSSVVGHDVYYSDMIGGEKVFGDYCWGVEAATELYDAPPGSVVSSLRANSYKCLYAKIDAPIIAVVGGDNYCETNEWTYEGSAIVISNGCDCNSSIEYLIPDGSQSGATAVFSRGVGEIQQSRIANQMSKYSTSKLRPILSASSDLPNVGCGEPVDWDRAIDLATTPVDLSWLIPIITYLTLDNDKS